jgi:hypothetical protein
MIDAHPQVAIPPETGFLPLLADLASSSDSADAAWRIITSAETFPDFHLDADLLRLRLSERAPCTPGEAARTFYRMYAERFGKDRWGDKTPAYGTAIDRIGALLPEAHFIHVIRDGRDVAVSVRPLWFAPGQTMEALARDWTDRIARTRELGSESGRYLEVRYESLVAEAEWTLRTIGDFLQLPFDPAQLAYFKHAPGRIEEHEERRAADGRLIISKDERRENQRYTMEPPRADRIGRWRQELQEDEVAAFESVAGTWLASLGYSRA